MWQKWCRLYYVPSVSSFPAFTRLLRSPAYVISGLQFLLQLIIQPLSASVLGLYMINWQVLGCWLVNLWRHFSVMECVLLWLKCKSYLCSSTDQMPVLFSFKKYFIYLYFIEGKGGRKRGREASMYGCLLHIPYWGPGLQLGHVPWLGIEPATL